MNNTYLIYEAHLTDNRRVELTLNTIPVPSSPEEFPHESFEGISWAEIMQFAIHPDYVFEWGILGSHNPATDAQIFQTGYQAALARPDIFISDDRFRLAYRPETNEILPLPAAPELELAEGTPLFDEFFQRTDSYLWDLEDFAARYQSLFGIDTSVFNITNGMLNVYHRNPGYYLYITPLTITKKDRAIVSHIHDALNNDRWNHPNKDITTMSTLLRPFLDRS